MYVLWERYVFVVFRDSIRSHSFKSSNSSALTSSQVESETFVDIQNTSKLTAMKEDIQGTDCNIFQPLTVLCMMWYCGYQATVWALVMIVLDMTFPYMVFSKPKLAHKLSTRIPRLLSPGNINRYLRYQPLLARSDRKISSTVSPSKRNLLHHWKGNSPFLVAQSCGVEYLRQKYNMKN